MASSLFLAAIFASYFLGIQQHSVERNRFLASVRSLDDPEDSISPVPFNIHLNDRTIRLSPNVRRPWVSYHQGETVERPKRKLILTDFGWNHPNQTYALSSFSRSIRSRELLQGYVDHPDFDPFFKWSDSVEGEIAIDPTMEYVVLMDIESKFWS